MNVKEVFLSLTDETLDPQAKKLIREWSDPPSALQILEVLDYSARYSWTSDFMMKAMDILFQTSCAKEGKRVDEIIAMATWRNEQEGRT